MAYIGNIPATSFEAVKKDRFTGLTGTSVTLSHSVSTVQDIVLWINAVKQDYTSYSVNGTALTVGGSLVSSDIVEVAYLGRTFQTVNPSDGSVGTSQVAASIITGQTELTDVPASTDEILLSDAGTLKRLDFSVLSSGMAIKKITVNDNITTAYSGLTGSIVTDHTLTDYNVTHTALSTSNKLAFFINIPYSNAVKANIGITDFKINDGSSDIKTGLFYRYNGSTGSGELGINAYYFNHTPASTNAITYTCKASIYRPSGSNTATIGLSSHPGRMMVVEY